MGSGRVVATGGEMAAQNILTPSKHSKNFLGHPVKLAQRAPKRAPCAQRHQKHTACNRFRGHKKTPTAAPCARCVQESGHGALWRPPEGRKTGLRSNSRKESRHSMRSRADVQGVGVDINGRFCWVGIWAPLISHPAEYLYSL